MMKLLRFTIVVLCAVYFLAEASAQVKSVKIGNQVWMAKNLDTDISGSFPYANAQSTAMYGRLYTYQAALKACPAGWRLPTESDWDELISQLGGEDVAAGKLKTVGNTGFNALYGGYANGSSYLFVGTFGGFWSATSSDTDHAWYYFFTNKSDLLTKSFFNKNYAFSVRCIKK